MFPAMTKDRIPHARPAAERSFLSALKQEFRSDEELAEQLRNGDADALAVLFKRHGGLLFGIARRILRSDAEAEDAVQQIFFDVSRSISQFDPEKGTFKRWLLLFGIVFTCSRLCNRNTTFICHSQLRHATPIMFGLCLFSAAASRSQFWSSPCSCSSFP
jgi:hypothetical protein